MTNKSSERFYHELADQGSLVRLNRLFRWAKDVEIPGTNRQAVEQDTILKQLYTPNKLARRQYLLLKT